MAQHGASARASWRLRRPAAWVEWAAVAVVLSAALAAVDAAGWAFGRAWVLLVVAFTVGSALTWMLFVLPAQRALAVSRPVAQPHRVARIAQADETPVVVDVPEQLPLPGVDSALSALDARSSRLSVPRQRSGAIAAGELGRLGIPRQDRRRRPS